MSLPRRAGASLVLACASLAACVASPSLTTSSEATGVAGPGGPSAGPDAMVLVPAVTFGAGGVAPTTVNPVAKGNGDTGKGEKGGHDAGADASGGGGGGAGNGGGGGSAGADAGSAAPPGSSPVVVPSFWIDATETSVASYRRCVASGTCALPTEAPGCTLTDGLEANPVTCVTLEQARVFCTWSSKRLVRDDEYTAAAAGSTLRAYPWGAEPPAADRLNACGAECSGAWFYTASDGFPQTAPTGSFPNGRTPEGAYDLSGNVAEWVEAGSLAVVRGGSYEDVEASSVSARGARIGAVPGPSVGFRCAADAAAR